MSSGRDRHGRGAGSYAAWWAAHGSLATSIQDAHSLYLETLGELGIVGLALLLLPFGAAAFVVATRLRHLQGDGADRRRRPLGARRGYLLAAGIDWMWELTAVSIVAFAALAVAVGACTPDVGLALAVARRRRFVALGAATMAVAWLGICAAALPLLTHLEIGASQAAARDGRTVVALHAASSAIRIQPWAAEPYLQLALVAEQAGRLAVADAAIRRAIARAPDDWHLWLVATRVQTKRGHVDAAREKPSSGAQPEPPLAAIRRSTSFREQCALRSRSLLFPGGIGSGRRSPERGRTQRDRDVAQPADREPRLVARLAASSHAPGRRCRDRNRLQPLDRIPGRRSRRERVLCGDAAARLDRARQSAGPLRPRSPHASPPHGGRGSEHPALGRDGNGREDAHRSRALRGGAVVWADGRAVPDRVRGCGLLPLHGTLHVAAHRATRPYADHRRRHTRAAAQRKLELFRDIHAHPVAMLR